MDRQKLLIGVLIISTIIAGIVNYRFFFKGNTKKKEAPAPAIKVDDKPRAVAVPRGATPKTPGGATAPKGTAELPLVTIKFEPIAVDTSLLESQLDSGQWGREPFLTPEELKPPAPVEKKAPEIEVPIVVNSILLGEGQSVAIINDSVYSIGEFVMGYRISAINEEGVLLEKAGLKRLVPLKANPVEVRSRER